MTEEMANLMADDNRVPTACTLPTVAQPVRRREFDELFAGDVVAVCRSQRRGLGSTCGPTAMSPLARRPWRWTRPLLLVLPGGAAFSVNPTAVLAASSLPRDDGDDAAGV